MRLKVITRPFYLNLAILEYWQVVAFIQIVSHVQCWGVELRTIFQPFPPPSFTFTALQPPYSCINSTFLRMIFKKCVLQKKVNDMQSCKGEKWQNLAHLSKASSDRSKIEHKTYIFFSLGCSWPFSWSGVARFVLSGVGWPLKPHKRSFSLPF